jgi:hypothetical protein
MIYNSFGEEFYIKGADIPLTTGFIVVAGRWLMPLLFAIAGISSAFALQKRSCAQYLKERVRKLLIPFIFGVLLIIPPQTFFADKFHNEFAGNYFDNYTLFFTRLNDYITFNIGFTPAHLWFLLYLFIISLVALPLMKIFKNSGKKLPLHKLPFFLLLVLFIIPWLASPVLDISGKSLGEFFVFFIFGYFILSDNSILERAEKYRFILLSISVFCTAFLLIAWIWLLELNLIHDIVYDIFFRFYAWITVLTLLGLFKHYFNSRNKVSDYFLSSSFAVYLFHQTWIIITAYYTFMLTNNAALQIAIILITSVITTFASFELCRRLSGTRFMFGIKK